MAAVLVPLATSPLRYGAWCDTCLLSSAVEVDIHRMCTTHGSHLIATVRRCTDCGEWQQVPLDRGADARDV